MKEEQSFEDYKKERRLKNLNLKNYLNGHFFFIGGTYNVGRNQAKRDEKQKKGLR